MVVAGVSESRSTDFTIARYSPTGTLDASFAGDGRQEIGLSDQNAGMPAIVIQPDGKMIVAGGDALAVMRLSTNGEPDPSFGHDGLFQAFGTFQGVSDVALQPDGKILAVGEKQLSPGHIAASSCG